MAVRSGPKRRGKVCFEKEFEVGEEVGPYARGAMAEPLFVKRIVENKGLREVKVTRGVGKMMWLYILTSIQ